MAESLTYDFDLDCWVAVQDTLERWVEGPLPENVRDTETLPRCCVETILAQSSPSKVDPHDRDTQALSRCCVETLLQIADRPPRERRQSGIVARVHVQDTRILRAPTGTLGK